jgi:hypothetical protein
VQTKSITKPRFTTTVQKYDFFSLLPNISLLFFLNLLFCKHLKEKRNILEKFLAKR